MVYIYVLELEQGKYYVGKTNNPTFRLTDHFAGGGSEWTKKYRPIKVVEIKPNCDDYDEDKITKQYMDKYGMNNVRGGSFVKIKLDEAVLQTLQQMNNGTNDKCFSCGQPGHFVKDCNLDNSDDSDGFETESETWGCDFCGKEFESEYKASNHEKNCRSRNDSPHCFRCGRSSHYASNCYASRGIDGKDLL